MSSYRLLWIGSEGKETHAARTSLESELDDVVMRVAPNGPTALEILAQDPQKYLLVIIDSKAAQMDPAALVTGVKQINPATEIIVMGEPGLTWSSLPLPKYYRPVLLSKPISSETLISCVTKLQEIVEAKEDYAHLSRVIVDNVGMSRTSTEALLRLMDRQVSLGVISMRRDGFFSSYNAEAERLTGYSFQDAAHIHVWCQALLTDDESVQDFLAAIDQFWARKTGKENLRLRIRRKDGRIVTLSLTVVVLLDNLGQGRQMVALFFDPLENWEAREYDMLMEAGCFGLYTYLPGNGFIRMSNASLDLFNRAFGLKLRLEDILNRELNDLPFPEEIVEPWRQHLHAAANDKLVPDKCLLPIGLPGKRILEHAFTFRIPTGVQGQFAILAGIIPREDLQANPLSELSAEMLAEKILQSIPRPFVFLKASRGEGGRILNFVCSAMNPAGAELFGLDQVIQDALSLEEIVPDREAGMVIVENARHVVETGRVREFEIQLRLGPELNVPAIMRFWLGKIGDGVAMFVQNITERLQEEQRLKHYLHVFSHMDEAIIVTDLDGNITDWNPASERMFGYSKSEILGKATSILTQSRKGSQIEQGARGVLREGDIWKGEYEFVRRDGTSGVAFSMFALLKDDQGRTYGTVGLCHDLTERKRLEEKLTAKSQELQEKNLALSTLLRHAAEERVRACEQVVADLSRKIVERTHHILEAKNDPQGVESQATVLLQELLSSAEDRGFEGERPSLSLSEKELEVAKLIRLGKMTEEIAFILGKSPDTIRLQRISIRKKLGLTRSDRNLASYLRKIDFT